MSKKADLQVADLIQTFQSGDPIKACALLLGTDVDRLRKEWIGIFGKDAYEQRKRQNHSTATSGLNNYQTRNKRNGKMHRNTKKPEEKARVLNKSLGYVSVGAPDWFTGRKDSGGRVHEHVLVYCEANGLTEIPKGYVVHHKNEVKTDNRKENLELLSRADHIRLHLHS